MGILVLRDPEVLESRQRGPECPRRGEMPGSPYGPPNHHDEPAQLKIDQHIGTNENPVRAP
jgi:hypothetical protein